MGKQRITEGSILEIKIENRYYVYAQILTKGLGYAFFDFKSTQRLMDFTVLKDAKILFILMVYSDVITQGRWLKVGKLPIRESLVVQPMKFIQDSLSPEKFELYNPNNGEIIPATKQEVLGLECAAVWEAEHVESRISDYYEARPNIWVEKLRIK